MIRLTPVDIAIFLSHKHARAQELDLEDAYHEVVRSGARKLIELWSEHKPEGWEPLTEGNIYYQYDLDKQTRKHMERKVAEYLCEAFDPESLYEHLVGLRLIEPLSSWSWEELVIQYLEIGHDVPPWALPDFES